MYGPVRYSEENFPRILAVVDKLTEIGKKHNATSGQVTLAWLLAQGDNIVVIPGSKRIKVCQSFLSAQHESEARPCSM